MDEQTPAVVGWTDSVREVAYSGDPCAVCQRGYTDCLGAVPEP
jgi:hypothetical protein